MNTEDQPVDVISAIRCVMYLLGTITKGRDQDAGIRYAFRGIDEILGRSVELSAAYGLVFAPRVIREWTTDLTINNRPWTDTHLLVCFEIYGPGGRQDRITAGPIRSIGRDDSDKGASKAHTQAFKTLLTELFQIGDRQTDADGTTHEADPRHAGPTPAQLAWKEAMDGLGEIIALIPVELRDGCTTYIKDRFGDPLKMTFEQIQEADRIAAGWDGSPPPASGSATTPPAEGFAPGEEPF